jgi:hypothetical protein
MDQITSSPTDTIQCFASPSLIPKREFGGAVFARIPSLCKLKLLPVLEEEEDLAVSTPLLESESDSSRTYAIDVRVAAVPPAHRSNSMPAIPTQAALSGSCDLEMDVDASAQRDNALCDACQSEMACPFGCAMLSLGARVAPSHANLIPPARRAVRTLSAPSLKSTWV